jgi:hypothetical protein
MGRDGDGVDARRRPHRQGAGRIEAGIRLNGRGGVMEIFAGYEKRVDADVLDRLQQRWGIAGLRLLSR